METEPASPGWPSEPTESAVLSALQVYLPDALAALRRTSGSTGPVPLGMGKALKMGNCVSWGNASLTGSNLGPETQSPGMNSCTVPAASADGSVAESLVSVATL